MTILLGKITGHFHEGMSLADYQRLSRLIKQYGTHAALEMHLIADVDENYSILHSALMAAEAHGEGIVRS